MYTFYAKEEMVFKFGQLFDKSKYSGKVKSLASGTITISLIIAIIIVVIVVVEFRNEIDEDSSIWALGTQTFVYSFLGVLLAVMIHDKSTEAEYREKHNIQDVSKIVTSAVGETTGGDDIRFSDFRNFKDFKDFSNAQNPADSPNMANSQNPTNQQDFSKSEDIKISVSVPRDQNRNDSREHQ